MTSLYHIFAGLALTVGCAQAVEIPADVVDMTLHNQVMDPELLQPLEQGIDRWARATCLDLQLDGAGVKWQLAHEPLMVEVQLPTGEMDMVAADGLTTPDPAFPTDILIADYVVDKDFAVAHELGHRLGMQHTGPYQEPDLMSVRRTVNRKLGLRWSHISETSVAAVCAVQPCGCFNPETGPVPL